MTKGDVRTRYDGHFWTYEIEGERPLGHAFVEKATAVAGGRFLAQQHQSVHVIEEPDGTVAEVHSYESEPGDDAPG